MVYLTKMLACVGYAALLLERYDMPVSGTSPVGPGSPAYTTNIHD